ncbi:peptidase S41 [Clostridium novyi A str. 4552]|uniref:Peptidase S41 n=1 Tax=Clostridium novyi A str. 4552 TaxID=1444289 RepID=A0A0A0I391_CLONO|nr:S41 family peptidase [Clostridium novyi]KGM94781.1 peptidase S41 [Clostridium novyi A str. 4552]
MKKIVIACLILLIIFITYLAGGFRSKYAANPNNRNDIWIKDLEYLKIQLPKKHKNLFFSLKEEKFNDEIVKLKSKIPNLNDDEVKVEIYKIMASIKDGHTNAYCKMEKIFPIKLYWFKEGIYVINTLPQYEKILDCRLIKINGKEVKDIEKEMSKIISHENEAQLKNEIPKILCMPNMLYGLKVINSKNSAIFTFKNSKNEVFDINIGSVNFNKSLGEKFKIHKGREKNSPLYMQNPKESYWFKYLKKEKIIYFKYNMCKQMKEKPFEKFYKELLDSIDKNKPQKLVIDLRDNGGGSSSMLDPLIQEIKNRNINNENRLFVIVGRKTFSSAILNAITLQNETCAKFIGEPTGGKPNHYGEVKEFKLPNSKMSISYSIKYFKTSQKDSDSFIPDIIIEPSINEYLKNKDSILDKIISRL